MEGPKRWFLQDALAAFSTVELPLLSSHYMVTMRGEVLTTGRAKELNLVLIPVHPAASARAAVDVVATSLGAAQQVDQASSYGTHVRLYLRQDNKQVDLLVLPYYAEPPTLVAP